MLFIYNIQLDERGVKNRGGRMKISLKKKTLPQKILTKKEYEQFQECKGPMTKEEQIAAVKIEKEERERLIKESMERKEEFRRIDMNKPQKKSVELIEIEEEAKNRTKYVLERAQNMKLEQEEEIQKCNRIILETKCRAIRDAQVSDNIKNRKLRKNILLHRFVSKFIYKKIFLFDFNKVNCYCWFA